MNKIAERAGELGLFATANALADATLDPRFAASDPRLIEAPGSDAKRLLGQMARRGNDPRLVRALWATLAGRPLEQALVAVDVLAQAIWSPQDALLGELREAAALLGDARTAGEVGIDLNAHPASSLIGPHLREPESASTVELLARTYIQDLGALEVLRRRGDDLLARLPTRESLHAFARLAALARLPTLASVYCDWLVRGLGWPVPMVDLCETLFDAGVAHKIPGDAIDPTAVPEHEQQDLAEYLLYRSHLGVGDPDSANALVVKTTAERPRWTRSPGIRNEVVRAHLGTLYDHGRDVPLARIEAACAQDPLWRYGAQVRAIVAADRAPLRALDLFHTYLGSFGNDFDTTLDVISIAPEPVKRDVARILCREAFFLPHEPAPWKLLGVLFGVEEPIADEIDARLSAQSA